MEILVKIFFLMRVLNVSCQFILHSIYLLVLFMTTGMWATSNLERSGAECFSKLSSP